MMPGPQYETPAEIRALQTLGADLVGMSTVHEAVAARAEGAEVLALSLVTNLAAGLSGERLDHAEVLAAGRPLRLGWGPCSPRWSANCDSTRSTFGRSRTRVDRRRPRPHEPR